MKMDSKTKMGGTSEKSIAGNKSRNVASTASGKITEKKRMKRSDIQFANIIEKMTEGFVALDAQMNYTYINQRAGELLKRKPEDLIGKNYWEEYPEDKNTSFGQAYLRALDTQIPIELEDYYAPGDRWFENRIYPSPEGLSIFFNDITERKRVEEAMHESEEHFQTLANGSPVLLWVNGLEGCEFVNREYLDFLGLASQTNIRGYDWSGFVHPDDREAYMAAYLRAFEKQALFSAEFRFRRQDGEYRWMRSEATPRRAADGSFLGYVGATIDITVRKRAEQALREKDQQFRRITDVTPTLFSQCSSDLRYLFVNRAAAELLGYPAEEIVDKPIRQIMGEAAFEVVRPYVDRVLKGERVEYETEIPYRTIGPRFMHVVYVPEIDAEGTVVGWIGTVVDITERKRTERALAEFARQQEALYQLTDRLQHTKTLEDIFSAALDAILSALECNRASILLFDKADVMRFVAWRGLSDDYRTATDGHSPWKPDEKDPQPICMNDVDTAELSESLRTIVKSEGIGSLAFIPLVFNGKLIGKFMAYFNGPHAFSERETELSLTIARQLAVGIERKRDEDALRRSEERLRLATQAAQIFTWEFDIQNQTSMVADNFVETMGFTAGLIPKHKEEILQTLIHPEDAQRIFAVLTKAVKDHHDLRSVQFRILNPENSQPIWLEVNGKVIYDSTGNPERMFGVAQNITESKQTESYIRYLNTELQAQLDEMNTLLKILPTGVWIGNHDLSEITGNPAAYEMLGIEPGTNVSVTNPERQMPTGLRIFVNGKEVDPENAPMQAAARSGTPLHGFEHELLFPDGSRKSFYASAIPLFDEHGAVRKVIGSYTDFTERKQTENRLALLAEISELTRNIEDPNEFAYAIAKAVGEHLQVKRCLFNETDVEKDIEIVRRDYHNGVESVAGVYKISDYSSITSLEMMAGKTVINSDSKIDPRTAQDYERTYERSGERAYVAVPLMRENHWVGTLWVSDDKPRQWSQEEVSLLETVAERTWTVIEKLRINTALRESDEKYRRIVETANEGIWEIDGDTRTIFVNPRMAEMLGHTMEEMMGRSSFDFIFPEENAESESRLARAKSGIPSKSREFRFRRKDGSELWTLVSSSPQLDPQGNFIGSTAMIADMTERKQMEDERNQLLQREQAQRASAEQAKLEAEQARAEAERELAERKLAEAALGEWADAPLPQDKRSSWLRYGAAFVVTLIAVLIRAAFDPLLGDALALVTIYGAVAFSVWYGGVGPALLSALVGYVAITGLILEPRHVVTLNAQTITGFALFLFSNTVVMSLGETMRRAQHHAHQSARVAVERQRQAETQLLDKQRAEESLRQSEALYRGIARSIPGGGVYVVDKDFRCLVAEGPVTDAFGLSREMLEGNTVSDAFPEGPAEGMEARLRKNFAGETVDFETEHNGRFYWTQQAPMMNSVGSVDNAIIMTIDITERKQAEEALRRSEERFARFMQYLPGLAWIKDSDGRYIYANDAAAKAFNTPIEELYGRTDEEIFPAEVAAQFRTNDQLALMDEKGVQVTETLEHEDGVLHHSLVSKFPIPGPDDSSTLIGGTAFDITERRQAEEALRESEARLRAVFDGTYEYIGLLSPEGTLLEANRAALEFDNNTREDVIGRPFWETPWWLYTPGAAEALRDSIGRAADGEFIRYEAPLNRRSGETIIFDFSLHPIRDEQGEVVFLVPEGRNITDRKQAEGALRESEERFRALLRQATAGIVRKDAEGKFIFVNDAFCNMLGYDESELLGKTVWQFTHQDDLEENKRLFERAMVEGIPFKLEKRLIRKDGSIIWVDVSVSPIIDAAGTPNSAVAVEVDITRRKHAEEALQQLNLQLESRVQKRTAELQVVNQSLRDEITERQKVEDALHESRNRLQTLSQRLVDVQEEERRAIARELHDRVGQSLSALNINLVILDNQISTHVPSEISARLDDSMQLVSETITLVRDVMSDLRPPVLDDYGLEAALQSHVNAFKSRYSIEVQFEKPDQPIPRLGASIEMTFLRIAQEALMNVARHARAEKVMVSIKQDENMVRLIVQDNGTGIQSWQDANRPGSHGLTIMRERAEAFGGDLKVLSTPGKGTQVEASIPIGVGRQDNIQEARHE